MKPCKILILGLIIINMTSIGHAFLIKGPQKTLEAPAYQIRGVEYLPLTFICDAYGIDWKWDSSSMIVDLNKGNAAVRLRVGEYKVYTNGIISVEERPVVFYKGAVYIPVDFLKTIFNRFFLVYGEKTIPEAATREIITQRQPCFYRKIKRIILDAGHGGYDPGAIGRDGIKEKYIALDITKKVKAALEDEGIEAVLTRNDDRFVPLWRRVEIANRSNADLFISIHANASRARRLKGFEVYYLSEALDDDARAANIAKDATMDIDRNAVYKLTDTLNMILWDLELTEDRRDAVELGNSILDNIDVGKRDIKSARFFVLKGVRMPAVLIEVGYISNKDECSKLGGKAYRTDIANKIVKGILLYKRKYESSGGFTD